MAINQVGKTNNVDFNQQITQVNEQKKIVVGDNSVSEKGSIQEKLVVNSGENQKLALNNKLDQTLRTGTNVKTQDTRLALANSNAEAENLVNRLTSIPPKANQNDLMNALKQNNRSTNPEGYKDFRATVIAKLVEKDPERAAALFSNLAGSPDRQILSSSINNAYEKDGKAFLDRLIKDGVGADSTTAPRRAANIGRLIENTFTKELKRDYAQSSLTLAANYRESKGNPARQAISDALTNAGLNVAASDELVLKDLFDTQAFSLEAITSSIKSRSPAVARVLDVASKFGYGQGTQIFFHLADNIGSIKNPEVKRAMVDYFNNNGEKVASGLSAGSAGTRNAKKLAKFFEKVVMPNSEFMKSTFSPNGGFDKALKNAISRFKSDPQTAAGGVGRLLGALQRGLQGFKGSAEDIKALGNFLGDTIGGTIKSAVDLGPIGAKIGEAVAAKIQGDGVDTAEELISTLNEAFFDGIDTAAEELNKKGRLKDAQSLYQFKRAAFSEKGIFLDSKKD
jgi:hypothetical protein